MDLERKTWWLRAILTVIGITATLTGIVAVLTGSSGQVGGAQASASVESELRFFAAFWIAYGAAALYVAPRALREIHAVRALALFLFLGGVARGIAWIADGRPHTLFVVLLALELLLPPAVLLLQRSIVEDL